MSMSIKVYGASNNQTLMPSFGGQPRSMTSLKLFGALTSMSCGIWEQNYLSAECLPSNSFKLNFLLAYKIINFHTAFSLVWVNPFSTPMPTLRRSRYWGPGQSPWLGQSGALAEILLSTVVILNGIHHQTALQTLTLLSIDHCYSALVTRSFCLPVGDD